MKTRKNVFLSRKPQKLLKPKSSGTKSIKRNLSAIPRRKRENTKKTRLRTTKVKSKNLKRANPQKRKELKFTI